MDPADNAKTHIIENPVTLLKKVVVGLKFLPISYGTMGNESTNNTRPLGVNNNATVSDSETSVHLSNSREGETTACLKMYKNFYVYYFKESHASEPEISKVKCLSIHDPNCTESEYNLLINANKEKSLSYIEVPILQLPETNYEQVTSEDNTPEQETKKINKSSETIEDDDQNNIDNNFGIPLNRILQNQGVQTALCPCRLAFSFRVLPKIAGRAHKIAFSEVRKTRSRSQQTKYAKANLLNKSTVLDTRVNYKTKVKPQKEKVISKNRGISTETNGGINNKTQTDMNKNLSKSVQTKPHFVTKSVGVQKYLNKGNNNNKTLLKPFNTLYKKDPKDIKKNRQSQANVPVVPKASTSDKHFEKINAGIKFRLIGKISNIPNEINYSVKTMKLKRNLMTLRSVKSDFYGNKHFNADKNTLKQANSKAREPHFHTLNFPVNAKSTNSDSKSNKSVSMNLRSVKSDLNGNKHVISDYYNNPLEKRKNIPPRHFSLNNRSKNLETRKENYGFVSCECTKSDINVTLPKHRIKRLCRCRLKEMSSPYHNNFTKRESGDWLEKTQSAGRTGYFQSKNNKNVRDKMYRNREDIEDLSENTVSVRRNKEFRNKRKKINYPQIGSRGLLEITELKRSKEKTSTKSYNDSKPKKLYHSKKGSGGLMRKLKKIRNKSYYDKHNKITENSEGWSKYSEPLIKNNYQNKKKINIGTRLKKIFKTKEKSENGLENIGSMTRMGKSRNKSKTQKIKYTHESGDGIENTERIKRKYNPEHNNDKHNNKKNNLKKYSRDRRNEDPQKILNDSNKRRKIKYSENDSGHRLKNTEPLKNRRGTLLNKIYKGNKNKNIYDTKHDRRSWLEDLKTIRKSRNPQRKSYDKDKHKKIKYTEDDPDDRLENAESQKIRHISRNKMYNGNKRKKLHNIDDNRGDWLENTEPVRKHETRSKSNDNNKHKKIKYNDEDPDNWLENIEPLKRRGTFERKINRTEKYTEPVRRDKDPRSENYDNNKHKKIKYTEENSDDWSENIKPLKRRGAFERKINNSNKPERIYDTEDDRRDLLKYTEPVRRDKDHRSESYDNNKQKKTKYTEENSDDWLENIEPLKRRGTFERKVNNSNEPERIYDTEDDRRDWLKYTEPVRRHKDRRNESYDNDEHSKIKYTQENSNGWSENIEPIKRRGTLRNKINKGNKNKNKYDTEDDIENWLDRDKKTSRKNRNPRRKNYENDKRKKIKYTDEDPDEWLENADSPKRLSKRKTIYHTDGDREDWLDNTESVRKHQIPQRKKYDNKKRKKMKYTDEDPDHWLENAESPKRISKRKKIYHTDGDREDWLGNTESVRKHQIPRSKNYDNKKRKKIKYAEEDSDDWLEYAESVKRLQDPRSKSYDSDKKLKYAEGNSDDGLENTQPVIRRGAFKRKMYKGSKHKRINDTEDDRRDWLEDTESARRYQNLQNKRYENNKHNKIKYFEDDSDDWLEKRESLKRKEARNINYYNDIQKLNGKDRFIHPYENTGSIRRKGKARNKSYNKPKKILGLPLGHNFNMFRRNRSPYGRLTEFNQQPVYQKELKSYKNKDDNSIHEYRDSQGSKFFKSHGKRKIATCDCPKKKGFYHNLCDAAVFSINLMKNGLKYLYKKLMNHSNTRQRNFKKENVYTDYEKELIKSFTCNKYFDYKYIRQQLTRLALVLCACVLLCPCILTIELCRTWLF